MDYSKVLINLMQTARDRAYQERETLGHDEPVAYIPDPVERLVRLQMIREAVRRQHPEHDRSPRR